MKTIDAGHKYQADCYDGGSPVEITFMKREGAGYPGNVGHYPGTNCQEVIRVLIDRITYLDNQIHHENNIESIRNLKEVLWLFEKRAAERHGIKQFEFTPEEVSVAPTCTVCGHIVCHGH